MQWWKVTRKPWNLAMIQKNMEQNRFAFYLVSCSGRSSSGGQREFNLREIQKRDTEESPNKVEKS